MKKQNLFIIGLVVALLVLAGLFVFNRSATKNKDSKIQRAADPDKNDHQILKGYLKDGNAPESEVYGAVIRLAQAGDSISLEVAKKLTQSKSKMLREGAAQALGYFPDTEIRDSIVRLTLDPDESVRVFAYESLSVMKSAERLTWLESRQKEKSLTPTEKVALLGSLYQLQPKDEKKKVYLDELMSVGRGSNAELSKKAALKVMQVSGQESIVKDFMIDRVRNSKDEAVMSVAIRRLANRSDPWIRDQLGELVKSNLAQVRIAALQSLHRACPAQRWSIIESVVKYEKDTSVLQKAFEATLFLEKSKSEEFLQKLASDTTLDADRKSTAGKFLAEVKSRPAALGCSSPATATK